MSLLSWNGAAQQDRGDRRREKKRARGMALNIFIIQMNEIPINDAAHLCENQRISMKGRRKICVYSEERYLWRL